MAISSQPHQPIQEYDSRMAPILPLFLFLGIIKIIIQHDGQIALYECI